MGGETEIRRWHEGPQREDLKAEEHSMLSRIAVVCPAPRCGLAFVELNALGVHANEKHGMKFKIPSCAVKSVQSTVKRIQSYRGQKVSEGLRRYHRKRRMTAAPQEDLSPLLAQADQLLATIKTQPQQQLPHFQRLHYRLHPPPLFPQTLEPSDDQDGEEGGYQMPPRCLFLNPNTSQYQYHPLQQASNETDHQPEFNQNCQSASNFTRHPMLPSFPSAFQQTAFQQSAFQQAAFQQAAGRDAGQEGPCPPWYQMPESTNPWIAPADTVEADHRTYRVL